MKMVRFTREKDGKAESLFVPFDEFVVKCLTAEVPGGPETLLKLITDTEVTVEAPSEMGGYKFTVELGEALVIPVHSGWMEPDQRTGASPTQH